MIRLILIILLLLISLLAFLRAPAYYLWLLAIAVTEYPLVFAGITTMITLSGFWIHKYQLAGSVLGVIALAAFLSPLARAYTVAKDIKHDMSLGLNGIQGKGLDVVFPDKQPFSVWNLFSGVKTVSHRSITYVKYPEVSLDLDFYQSQIPGRKPCIIVVHGGSWSSGDSKQLPELNSYLATKGFNVAAINYRMAPKFQTPAPVEDVKAALVYLKKHAAELQIDTDKLILLGRSAGAQIALLAAYTLHDPGIKGVIDFYGPADMVWGYSVPSNPLIMNSRKVMENYLGGTYQHAPEKYTNSSPIEFVDRNTVPTLIIHGGNDVLVSPIHSRKLNATLLESGVKHYILRLPWATHGFDYNLNGPGGQLSTFAVESFLNTVTQ